MKKADFDGFKHRGESSFGSLISVAGIVTQSPRGQTYGHTI